MTSQSRDFISYKLHPRDLPALYIIQQ